MDTVTYPNEEVAAYLNEHFACVQINTAHPENVRDLVRQYRQWWTPTFVFLDHHKIEVRRTVGALPPQEFLPELMMARGSAAMLNGKYADAYDLFTGIAEQYPQANCAPEAMYFAGVAAYRRDGDATGLRATWFQLKERYPNSVWWTKASFIDKK